MIDVYTIFRILHPLSPQIQIHFFGIWLEISETPSPLAADVIYVVYMPPLSRRRPGEGGEGGGLFHLRKYLIGAGLQGVHINSLSVHQVSDVGKREILVHPVSARKPKNWLPFLPRPRRKKRGIFCWGPPMTTIERGNFSSKISSP